MQYLFLFCAKITTCFVGYSIFIGAFYCCGTQTIDFDEEMENMSSKNNNQLNIPEAREAMDQFKMEAARDEDVPTPS